MNDLFDKHRPDARVIAIRGAREQQAGKQTGKRRRLSINPILGPLFRKNLRTALGQYGWKKLRSSLLSGHILKCEICRAKPKKLYGHEVWRYETVSSPAVARLIKIRFLCGFCHGCEHFPHTLLMMKHGFLTSDEVKGTIRHYCRINKVARVSFNRDFKNAMERWKYLSNLTWALDYGSFAAAIDEKRVRDVKRAARVPVKLMLNRATDSEPVETFIAPRRGRPPLFGRPMTSKESSKRSRYLRRQREQDFRDLREIYPQDWPRINGGNNE